MDVEKCRLCLSNKKNVRSVFEIDDNNYSYVHMITSFADIKILRDDGITEKICLKCRKLLREVFEFKLMIERSDAALQTSCNRKMIQFDNFEDIKVKVEVSEDNEYPSQLETNINNYFESGESSFTYKGTIIKKVATCDSGANNGNSSLSELDFLHTTKMEPENDLDDNHFDESYENDPISHDDKDDDDDDDDKYIIPLSERRKTQKAQRQTNKPKENDTEEGRKRSNYYKNLKLIPKPIKPVFLKDVCVLRTKKYPDDTKREYKCKSRKEMCNVCGKMKTNLRYHLLTHTGVKSHKCDVCGRGFLTARSLLSHKNKHITNVERKFKCDHCIADFRTKLALRSHMISHSVEKKHVCEVCSKKFKRRSALLRHSLLHNSANKKIACDLCRMSFFTKGSLIHHMRVHTGERPYNCQLCSQPYSYKHDFNRHCFKKHGIFLKRRNVTVMNEEVLKREKALMKDLMLKIQDVGRDGENINPFEGPQAAMAFEQAVKALKEKRIPLDFNI